MLLRNQQLANLIAIVASGLLSWAAPLQVFVLAYVFLGPLHYLTEIAWLDKKNFYHESPRQGLLYFFLALVLCAGFYVGQYLHLDLGAYLVLIALILALRCLLPKKRLVFMIVLAASLFLLVAPTYAFFFLVLVPTFVHVYIFTLVFMMVGTLREGSLVGFAGIVAMLLIPLCLLLMGTTYDHPTQYWLKAADGFSSLQASLQHLLLANRHPTTAILSTPGSAAVMRLLAFAYLYHYLNWFLKTGLLGWHKLRPFTWWMVCVLYAVTCALYLWNFKAGAYALFYLSILHVLLEFPLNWKSFDYLGQKAKESLILPRAQGALGSGGG